MARDRVPMFQFADDLVLLQTNLERGLIGLFRQVEQAGAQRPRLVIQLERAAKGKAPRIGGIIERTGIDQRPVEHIAARIMGIAVGVEHIDHAEFAQPQHQTVGGLFAAKLVGGRGSRRDIAAKIDCLAQEQARQFEIGCGLAHLVGLATGEPCNAQRVRQAETLIEFGVHPQFATGPGPDPDKQCGIGGFAGLMRCQTVGAGVGRRKAGR